MKRKEPRKGENPETPRPCRDASRDTVAPEKPEVRKVKL